MSSAGSLREGFGALLRDCRASAGVTQEGLAARSGLSVRAIRDLERGRVRVPQRESVTALVTALGLGSAAAERLGEAARAARSVRVGRSVAAVGARPGGLCALPSGVADFTGRAEELDRLRALAGRLRDTHARLEMPRAGDLQVRECWQEALEIYERLDVPEAEQVRELLGGRLG